MMIAARSPSTFAPILSICGILILIIGVSEWMIGIADWIFLNENAATFLLSGAITNFFGFLIYYLSNDGTSDLMSKRQVLATIILAWPVTSLFAVLPFMIGAPHLSFEKALFESVSALTTTGATVMIGLDDTNRAILFFRSLLHWYGGMGIVIGAMVLFPAMRLGGMQFFLRAGSESEDKLLPSARALGLAVFGAYSLLTVLCALAYMACDMPGFDAVNHAMSTMATGGLAVSDASFANYSAPAKLAGAFFMLLAGIPLVLHIQFLNGKNMSYWRDPQVRTFLTVFLIFAFLITLFHIIHDHPEPILALADAVFNTASILTGTGFTDGDYQTWGAFPTALLFLAMFIGGCTGSTTGGIKIFRFQVLVQIIRSKIKKIIFPHSVATPKYDGETIDDSLAESVAAFFMIYMASFAFFSIAFAATGLDFISSFSAAASAVGNIGPALGDQIGPVGNYADFNSPQLALYITGMILGRLEFMVFMVLFLPRFWRH